MAAIEVRRFILVRLDAIRANNAPLFRRPNLD